MLTIHVWPRRLKDFLLTHPLYKSPGIPAHGSPEWKSVRPITKGGPFGRWPGDTQTDRDAWCPPPITTTRRAG